MSAGRSKATCGFKPKRGNDLPTRAELRGINALLTGRLLARGVVPRCRRANGRKWRELVARIEAAALGGRALPGISAAEAQMLLGREVECRKLSVERGKGQGRNGELGILNAELKEGAARGGKGGTGGRSLPLNTQLSLPPPPRLPLRVSTLNLPRKQLARRLPAEEVRAVLGEFCGRRCSVGEARARLGVSRARLFALAREYRRARRGGRAGRWEAGVSGRRRKADIGYRKERNASEGALTDSLGRRRGAERPTFNVQRPTSKDGGEGKQRSCGDKGVPKSEFGNEGTSNGGGEAR